MIKAVLWDFGGVLTSSPFQAFNRFERAHGIPRDFIRDVNATNLDTNAWAQFESNRLSLEQFDRLFAAETSAAGHEIRGKAVIPLLSGELRPRMIRALERCKSRFTVACITNNVHAGCGPGMAVCPDRAAAVSRVMALFDIVVESRVEGLRKPDPRIYTLTCERVGIEPGEAVYLDDLGINLKPARALGMHTVKVVNEDQALADLAVLTGLDFD